MLRERVTWFSLGAASAAAVALLIARHSSEELPRAASPIAVHDIAAQHTANVPAPVRESATAPRIEHPALPIQSVAPSSHSAPQAEAAALDSPPQPLRAGQQIVAHALESGRWSNEDAAALAAVSGSLNEADRRDLYGRLAVAINENRVQVERGLMPR